MKTVKANKNIFMQAGGVLIDIGVKWRSTSVNIFIFDGAKFLRTFFHKNNAVDLMQILKGKSFSLFLSGLGVLAHNDVWRIAVSPRKGKVVADFLHFDIGKGTVIQLDEYIYNNEACLLIQLHAFAGNYFDDSQGMG